VTVAGLVAIFILVIFVASPGAQQAQAPAFVPGAPVAAAPEVNAINLLVGRSTVLNVERPIERVSLTTPDIADAVVTSPQQILIHGKTPGTISLFVWDRAGGIKNYEVSVRRDLSALGEQMRQLFPGEPVSVAGNGKDVVISGTVSSKYVIEKAADVAAGYVEKKENVVNLLRQQEGVASNQVMLRVRFAEVSRNAVQQLGASYFTGPGGFHDYVSQVSTQQFPTVFYDELTRESIQGVDKWGGGRDTVIGTGGKMSFSDLLNLFIFNNRYNVGMLIKAMQQQGLFQSLAEPNLIATNGKEASFLAGGEFPYPVVQGTGSNLSVTIQFKEFGVRLNFTPTVLGGDLINLKVRPEVSSLDFNNAVILQGFRIPALATRRTETEVELQDGQTFAIAGLLNNTVTDTLRKIPGIGDIPVLGWLFKSKALEKQQTELVVLITPQILKRGSTGVASGLPNNAAPFMAPLKSPLPPPPPHAPKDDQAAAAPASGTTGVKSVPVAVPVAPAAGATAAAAPAAPVVKKDQATQAEAARSVSAAQLQATAEAAKRAEAQARQQDKKDTEAVKQATETTVKQAREQAKKDAELARRAAETTTKQQQEQEKLEREQAKKDAEAAQRAAVQAEKDRKVQEKLAREQAKKDAEAAKRAAEIAKKQQKQEQERAKALAEAEARLRAAQAAYQAEVKKQTKPGGDSSGKTPEQK
jgi:pilus assembly protein CpaC